MANLSIIEALRKTSLINKKYIDKNLVFNLKAYLEALTLVNGETYVYNITTTQLIELKEIFSICVKVKDLNNVTRLINNVNVTDTCIELNTINSDSTDKQITTGDIYLSLNNTSGYIAYYHNYRTFNMNTTFDENTGDLALLGSVETTVGEKFS